MCVVAQWVKKSGMYLCIYKNRVPVSNFTCCFDFLSLRASCEKNTDRCATQTHARARTNARTHARTHPYTCTDTNT